MTQDLTEANAVRPDETGIFGLAVYEAGHAIAARALGLRIISLKMLPRPAVLESEKTFSAHSWQSFIETLEIRVIELMGGQIAERLLCNGPSCCPGDISRIDELTRMIAAFDDARLPEDIWFDLEDMAEAIFAQDGARAALLPLSLILQGHIREGQEMTPGEEIEAVLDDYMPRPKKAGLFRRLTGRG